MKKTQPFKARVNGDFLPDPILCSAYMVQRAAEMEAQGRMRLSANTGFLRWLISPANTSRGLFDASAIEAKLNNPDGQKILVRRRFRPIKTVKALTGNARNYCAPITGAANPFKEDVVNLGFDYSEILMKFNESDLRLAGMGSPISEAQAEVFARELIAFENTFGALVMKRILAGDLVGNFKDGDTVKDLPLYLANGMAVNPTGNVLMHQWMSEVGLSDMPLLVGGSLVNAYAKVRQTASANLAGFNPALADEVETIYDLSVGQVLGDPDDALLIAPGALHMFTYNLHKGEYMKQESTSTESKRYRLVSPYTGIEWDAYWQRKRNCDTGEWEWQITLSLVWDIVGLPECWSEDACMDGVKDVFRVHIVCADTGVCEIDRSESCIDAPNLPLAPNTIDFPAAAVLCAQACRLILNTSNYPVLRTHTVTTASTGSAIGIDIGGSTFNFDTPIVLGDAPGAAALQAAIIDKIGAAGLYVSAVFSTPNTLITVVTDGDVPSVELVIAAAANIELTATEYTNACRVTSIIRPSTGATSTSLKVVNGSVDTTGAPTALIAQTDAVGTFEDFFVFGDTPWTRGAALTVTYTDSAACTSVDATVLCTV